MEFKELVESIREEEATIGKMFGSDTKVRGRKSPEYLNRLSEAAQFVAEVAEGRRSVASLKEAMTTADFPLLFGDIIDRQVLAAYREAPQVWSRFCTRMTVSDFREAKLFRTLGADTSLAQVDEQDPYLAVERTEEDKHISVVKYGASFGLSWEALINDDLGLLRDQPERFGRAARRTEDKVATSQLFTTGGHLNPNIYTASNTIDTELTYAGLAEAIQKAAIVDTGGEPILNTMSILMVPPALELTARNLVNAAQVHLLDTDMEVWTQNYIGTNLEIVVNPWLPIVNGGDTDDKNKTWFLFANPSDAPAAVAMAFLRGHDAPEVFMKAPDAQRVGGGFDAFAGSFDNDSVEYKVRHVCGAAPLDAIRTVASTPDGAFGVGGHTS